MLEMGELAAGEGEVWVWKRGGGGAGLHHGLVLAAHCTLCSQVWATPSFPSAPPHVLILSGGASGAGCCELQATERHQCDGAEATQPGHRRGLGGGDHRK